MENAERYGEKWQNYKVSESRKVSVLSSENVLSISSEAVFLVR
jgi:hypothetical protein